MASAIGIIGYGHMGHALAQGLLKAGEQPRNILVAVRRAESAQAAGVLGLATTHYLAEIGEQSQLIFLCTASTQAIQTTTELARYLPASRRVALISMCAGVPLAQLQACLGEEVALIKAIANINIATCQGMAVIFPADSHSPEKVSEILALFAKIGVAFEARTESECDCLSAFSAAMPAYVAMIIAALVDAGICSGIAEEKALRIALQVVSATADSIAELGSEPDQFRRQVTTPGGVVVQGVKVLEDYRLRAALMEAFSTVARLVRERTSK